MCIGPNSNQTAASQPPREAPSQAKSTKPNQITQVRLNEGKNPYSSVDIPDPTTPLPAVGPELSVTVCVEGVPVDAVVDTGSQATIVSRSFLAEIEQRLEGEGRQSLARRKPQVRLYGKSGKELAIKFL